jgi:hypothetical protein
MDASVSLLDLIPVAARMLLLLEWLQRIGRAAAQPRDADDSIIHAGSSFSDET